MDPPVDLTRGQNNISHQPASFIENGGVITSAWAIEHSDCYCGRILHLSTKLRRSCTICYRVTANKCIFQQSFNL